MTHIERSAAATDQRGAHSSRAPAGVCVYAPETIVTVTLEGSHDRPEIHFHAGGQGFWIARLLGRLGVPTTMCTAFGGESGVVARALAGLEPIQVRGVTGAGPNGAWVHDRRGGERHAVGDAPGGALSRHVADELFGTTLTTGLEAGLCVLAGHRIRAVAPDHYERLAADLRANGVLVISDLSGDDLRAVLDAGVDFCKVSEEDLAATPGFDDLGPTDALQALRAAGARNAALTRGDEGLFAAIGDELLELRPPKLHAVDHRGSGDAFTALLAASVHWGLDWSEAVRWGAAAGALTAVRRGLATASRNDIHRLVPRIEVLRRS